MNVINKYHIVCLDSIGGVPVFHRSVGDIPPLSFATIGSLNATYLYCKTNDGCLKATYLKDSTVYIQEFDNRFLIMAIGYSASEKDLENLIQMTIHVIVMTIGMNSTISHKPIDILKRDLKHGYTLIDKIIQTPTLDIMFEVKDEPSLDNDDALNKLYMLCQEINTSYGSIHFNNKTVAATEGWCNLHRVERRLLKLLMESSLNKNVDSPVFLPIQSPNVAYRLIGVQISWDMFVCVLCGSEVAFNKVKLCALHILDKLQMIDGISGGQLSISSNFGHHSCLLRINVFNVSARNYRILNNVYDIKVSDNLLAAMDMHTKIFFLDKRLGHTVTLLTETYWSSSLYKCSYVTIDKFYVVIFFYADTSTQLIRLVTQKCILFIKANSGKF